MADVTPIRAAKPQVLEFFAGIGLAREGLEKAGFRVAWANDFEPGKKALYEQRFGTDNHFTLGDIAKVSAQTLPAKVKLAWASSPCTDLSLAGNRAGFAGAQSGTFWQFVRILNELGTSRPEVIVLENVVGLATSHGGDDLIAGIRAFNELGYSVDVLAIDARRFVPQSRPRLFLVGAQNPPSTTAAPDETLRPSWLQWVFEEPGLRTHRAPLPRTPDLLTAGLGELVEGMNDDDSRWWGESRTAAFLESLSQIQHERVHSLQFQPTVSYRTAYRRTRNGVAVWEVRPDDISGCLRTARGGSSKQAVVQLGHGKVRVRWMTPVEYARLMGAGDYPIQNSRPNQVLFGFGDAVAVPVVTWLANNYLMPLIKGLFTATPVLPRKQAHG